MRANGKSTRLHEREQLSLPLHVLYRESDDVEWTEATYLVQATHLGAGFTLARPVEPGRLLQLTIIDMPQHLRLLDQSEQEYRIWGVARYVIPLAPDEQTGLTRFSIGVAFTGERAPASYKRDPATRYDLKPILARNGLWAIREQPRRVGPYAFVKEDRVAQSVSVIIEAFDGHGRVAESEETLTENISEHGAAVQTSLSITPGSFVRLVNAKHNLSVLAVVRGSSAGADGDTRRVHLEFVDRQWPLDKISEA